MEKIRWVYIEFFLKNISQLMIVIFMFNRYIRIKREYNLKIERLEIDGIYYLGKLWVDCDVESFV